MAKKAYLVEFNIMTRVVVDSEDDNEIIDRAVEHIESNMIEDGIRGYICPDNALYVREDNEMPYNPEFDKD